MRRTDIERIAEVGFLGGVDECGGSEGCSLFQQAGFLFGRCQPLFILFEFGIGVRDLLVKIMHEDLDFSDSLVLPGLPQLLRAVLFCINCTYLGSAPSLRWLILASSTAYL